MSNPVLFDSRSSCLLLAVVLAAGCMKVLASAGHDAGASPDGGSGHEDNAVDDGNDVMDAGEASTPPGWRFVHHETFDSPFDEPPGWTEDLYDPSSYDVGPFDEDGAFFRERGGDAFRDALATFRSFRKSFTYGEDGWLTVELYGRDSDRDGAPETGGRFTSVAGRARLTSTRHYDAAIIRSTAPLPPRYRVEVAVSGIDFGGRRDGSWHYPDGRVNGYDGGDERADPWRFTNADTVPVSAYRENGLYFLCITDYANPAPHNNVFIHHHRKVVMDTDNNMDEWSRVYNTNTGQADVDGSHNISMLWLDGESFGSDWVGNSFISYVPRPSDYWQYDAVFADKYVDGQRYVFAIERDDTGYTLEVAGVFHHAGEARFRMTKTFRDPPIVWHYNQDPSEYDIGDRNEVRRYDGQSFDTWPRGSAYPDHFILGDPHINYYEGTAEFDDLKLYVPE